MAEWVFRTGLIFAGVGVLLLTPLADLLPVDLWLWAEGLFLPKGAHLYMMVVPGSGSHAIEYSLVALGVVMAVVGHFLRKPS